MCILKISELHIFQNDLPVLDGPYTMSYGAVQVLDSTLVKLVTDTGIEGWGETCPLGSAYAEAHAAGARAALIEMAPHLIGVEAFPNNARHVMDKVLFGHSYAKSALDIAVHDALGKSLGLRVADLLGGGITDRVPSYYAIGMETPEEAVRIAKAKCGEGFRRLQVKVAGRPIEEDVAVIRKVWEVAQNSQAKLVVDANRGWTTRDAIQVSRACADVPMVIEQPCQSFDDFTKLRPLLCHPLNMDESSLDLGLISKAAASGVVDGFGLKVSRLGGLQTMAGARDICKAANLPHTCDDSWGGDIVAAACTHIAATVQPNLLEGVWLAQPYIDGHYDIKNGVKVDTGHINLPSGPGLGIIPDPALFGEPVAVFS